MATHSPQQRSRDLLRRRGYTIETVEQTKRVGGKVWKVDLFGCIDILAIGHGHTLAVQVTTGNNHADRAKKVRDSTALPEMLRSGWIVMV